jgi:hypothetical protein
LKTIHEFDFEDDENKEEDGKWKGLGEGLHGVL